MESAVSIIIVILSSFVPAGAAMVWLFKKNPSFSAAPQLSCLAAGVVSVALAVLFQGFLPESFVKGRFAALLDIFTRIAMPEETARVIALALLFRLSTRVFPKTALREDMAAGAGFLLGLTFAALETAGHAITKPDMIMVRALTAAPLHGACGIHCALALSKLKRSVSAAAGQFLFALILHTLYNFMLARNVILSVCAVILAISALLSSIRNVKAGMEAAAR